MDSDPVMVLFKPRLSTRHTTRYSTLEFQQIPEPVRDQPPEDGFLIDFYPDSEEMTTWVAGNGSVVKNDVTKRFDQSTGIPVRGEAHLYTNRSWKPDNTVIIYEAEYNSEILGDGGSVLGTTFGFTSGFGTLYGLHDTDHNHAAFWNYGGTWRVILTRGAFGPLLVTISDIQPGVTMKIVLTSDYAKFYVGGNLVYVTTPATIGKIPVLPMSAGCGVSNSAVSTIATSNSVTGSVRKGL